MIEIFEFLKWKRCNQILKIILNLWENVLLEYTALCNIFETNKGCLLEIAGIEGLVFSFLQKIFTFKNGKRGCSFN